jgi:hypothetical protein
LIINLNNVVPVATSDDPFLSDTAAAAECAVPV